MGAGKRRRFHERDPMLIGELEAMEQIERAGYDADEMLGKVAILCLDVVQALSDGRITIAEAFRIGRRLLRLVELHRRATVPPTDDDDDAGPGGGL